MVAVFHSKEIKRHEISKGNYLRGGIANSKHVFWTRRRVSQVHSEPCETSKMKRFVKIVNGFNFQSLTIFVKRFILNVCQGSKYTYECKVQKMKVTVRSRF